MIQQDYFLKKFGIKFDKTDSAEEKLRQMTKAFGMHESYEGKEPYIFISYAHLDSALVLPAVKAIQEEGYPVWYDAGISPGSEWAADIAQHLKNASLVIAFVSEHAFDSPNCRAEIVYAFGHRKPMLTVQLDQTPLPDGLDMQLSLSQMFKAFAYDDGDTYVRKLSQAPILAEKIRPVLKEQLESKRREAEEAQRRKQAEEAERQRLAEEKAARERAEAEKAARERAEAEEAERKYQQAKEAARLRREAEEAQQKRWSAEQAAKDNERKQRDQARREKKEEEKQAKETAQAKRDAEAQIKKVDDAYRQVEFTLGAGFNDQSYAYAITTFNEKVCAYESVSPDTKARVAFLREKFYNRLYRDACEMEESKETRLLAAKVFAALPMTYKDALKRKLAIEKRENAKMVTVCILLPVLYLAMNICLSRYVLHLVDFWLWQFLLLVAPAVVTGGLALLAGKVLNCRADYASLILLALAVVTAIADPFLIQQLKVWVRIVYAVLSGLLNCFALFMCVGVTAGWAETRTIPHVKMPPLTGVVK